MHESNGYVFHMSQKTLSPMYFSDKNKGLQKKLSLL
jgi:hypothetical protein